MVQIKIRVSFEVLAVKRCGLSVVRKNISVNTVMASSDLLYHAIKASGDTTKLTAKDG